MRIALLTIWHVKNYGAELQAYATIKALSDLGYDTVMINILLSDQYPRNLKNRFAGIIESVSPCSWKFKKFWKKYIPTTKRYRSIKDIQEDPPVADVYIVGSDQVWNPEITKEFQKLYFLNFGDNSIKRVSYASSFGQTDMIYRNESEIQSLLNRFSAICCREESGVDLIYSRFDIKAQLVVDPCLLLESYSDFVSDITENGTLSYYPLSKDDDLEAYANKLASKLNLRPVNANKTTKILGKIVWNRPGIDEWLNYLAHSNFVLTRSFHGIVFSLIFHKQFAVLAGRKGRTTRLLTLLKHFNLEDRLFDSVEELDRKRPWYVKIDYAEVRPKLRQLRTESLMILKNMILDCQK